MKKLLVLSVCIALPLVAGTMSRSVRFDESDLSFSQQGAYTVVELAGGMAQVNPGLPRLPRVVQSLSIPAGAGPERVEITAEEWKTIPGSFRIYPSQPDVPLPMPGRDFTPQFCPEDAEVYGSSEPYPTTQIRLLETGTMSGYRIANVELWPLRYVPVTGELQLATRLAYRLVYAEGATDASVPTTEQQEMFGTMVRSMVSNPEDVRRFAPHVRGLASSFSLPPGRYDYVVISEPPLDTVFERLAEWKTHKGVPATVVTKSYIDANYTGYDLPEKFRNFISDARSTWGTMYVLLGGQADHKSSGQNVIPGRDAWYLDMAADAYPDEDTIPTDLYFGCLDGDWDANGNHIYGERSDDVDMLSEVFIGRAPVYSIEQAQNFVDKVLTYEQNPPAGYLKKMLLPTAILWQSYEERPTQESIARMTPDGWQDTRLYERTSTLDLAAMRDSMNSGYGLGHWVGHGDENGIYMGSSAYLNSIAVGGLTNGDKVGFHSAIACFTGAWDEVPGGDCFAEHLVNRVGGGAVAVAMNSRYGYGAYVGGYVPGPSERLDTVMLARILNHNEYHAGQALAFSRGFWAPYADSGRQYAMQRYCIYELNLFGDPELSIWTEEPTDVVVNHTGVVPMGNGVPYSVTVRTESAAPVESAFVLLQKGSEVFASGRTNSLGQTTLSVSALTPGPMALTVNAHNHRVFVDTVQAISGARHILYLRSDILDQPPGGNGDSIFNPGETVKIPLWVKNWGNQTATGVSAQLVTLDPDAQVTDSIKTFGDVGAGDSAWTGTEGFGLHVDAGVADGHSVPCSLVVRDALDSVWVSNVIFAVGAPVLSYSSYDCDDRAPGGNDNHRIDPGEQADLMVALSNAGHGIGHDVTAVLRSGDARLVVLDSTGSFGDIVPDSTGSNDTDRFRVSADASIPAETSIPCTLYVDVGTKVVVCRFRVDIGLLRPCDPIPDGPRTPPRYYAYDVTDTLYDQTPEYSWVEINGIGTRLSLGDDETRTVTLPAGFGPWRYYGERYDQISVCSNGWIAAGATDYTGHFNTSLPNDLAPPMVCASWDDYNPEDGGNIWYYHDGANRRFIVEFDSVRYQRSQQWDKFEMILYDTTSSAPSGDNEILVQYQTANNYHSNTIGLQDPTRDIKILSLYNGEPHHGAAAMKPEMAIRYITISPTAVAEGSSSSIVHRLAFSVSPNPFRSSAVIRWNANTDGKAELRVFDASGRAVRTLVSGSVKAGAYSTAWNGADDFGRKLARGVYFVRLAGPAGTVNVKAVLTD